MLVLSSTVRENSRFNWSSFRGAGQPDPHNIDGSAFGEGIDLSSTWLFSPTDKPENASPALDDRSWRTLTRDQIQTYDFHHLSIGWYRVHVHLPPAARNVVLVLDTIEGEYQAFANGVQVGGPARLKGPSGAVAYFPTNYRIPDTALLNRHGDLVLALRVSAWKPYSKYTGLRPGYYVHLLSAEAAPRDASDLVSHRTLSLTIEGSLAFLVGLVSLALYLAMRTRREYVAASVTLFLASSLPFVYVVLRTRPINFTVFMVLNELLFSTLIVANIEFVRIMLSRRRTRLILSLEVIVFSGNLAVLAATFAMDNLNQPRWWVSLGVLGSPSIANVLELALLIPACRRRNVDALVLLPILCVSFVNDFWTMCRSVLGELHPPIYLVELPSFHVGSYDFSFNNFDGLFFPIGILLFLVLRAVRIARERARVGAEIEAAQTMQQLLLARSSEPTPGFDVESVYLPASEVGGDFFLVSPDPHGGSLTAIVGDVSGKGLSAAMRVSMILGVLRREDSREPATILHRLNHALHAQGGDGFTTACCVRLEEDGSYRVANAGHISPYVNGDEVETSPGLPLGLVTGQEYEERCGQLAAGSRIVLMSDGVVEARGKKGELYGFDRLHTLTLKSAGEIAATAQAFGQDDDITVLTLACMA